MKLSFYVSLLLFTSLIFSQTPPNNDPTTAQAVTLSQNLCGELTDGTLIGATNSGKGESVCETEVKSDVWYTVKVPSTRLLGLEVSVDNLGTLVPAIDIYRGTPDNLRFKACSSAEPNGKKVTYTFIDPDDDLVAGETLYIRVWGLNGKQAPFGICAWSLPYPPKNETPSTAETITVGKFKCIPQTQGALFSATDSGVGFTGCEESIGSPAADVWYKVTVPESGNLSLELINKASKKAVLSYWTGQPDDIYIKGCVGGEYDLLVNLTKKDDEITPGETLYVRVSNYDDARFSFIVCAWETQ